MCILFCLPPVIVVLFFIIRTPPRSVRVSSLKCSHIIGIYGWVWNWCSFLRYFWSGSTNENATFRTNTLIALRKPKRVVNIQKKNRLYVFVNIIITILRDRDLRFWDEIPATVQINVIKTVWIREYFCAINDIFLLN